MTVQWVGTAGETADTTIYYSPRPATTASGDVAADDVKPYPHDRLQGLPRRADRPDARAPTTTSASARRRRRTASARCRPRRPTRSSFVSGGDCGVNAHAVANNIQAARQDPMFAVIGGDLGYDNGRSVEISLAFLRNYSQHMVGRDGRLIPMVACIGNHEVDGGYGKPRDEGPVLLRPVRRPVPRHRLRHARLRRLPEPGAARHRPHSPDRRRADRLARQDAARPGPTTRT